MIEIDADAVVEVAGVPTPARDAYAIVFSPEITVPEPSAGWSGAVALAALSALRRAAKSR